MGMARPAVGVSLDVRPGLRLSPIVLQSLDCLASAASELPAKLEAAAIEHPALEVADPGAPWMRADEGHRTRTRPFTGDVWNPSALDPAAPPPGLEETLLSQIRLTRFAPDERELALAIVGSLDDDGYLRASFDELVALAGVDATPARFEAVLARVQSFDPPGVAARDLAECVALQLREHEGAIAALAVRMVRDHLLLLARGRIGAIAEALHVDAEQVQEAAHLITRLDPAPGLGFGSGPVRPRVPDVTVVFDGTRWVARLCNDGVKQLRVPDAWRRPPADASDEDRAFLARQAERADAFVRCLAHRSETLLRVAESIVLRQQAFFTDGPAALRPLTLREVADELGVATSTVSRAVSGKSADTPLGLIPLKRFFPAARAVGAAAFTLEQVRTMIAGLITAESASAPRNDGELVGLLARRGVRVSRRTVANHRAALGIATATDRRAASAGGARSCDMSISHR